MFDRLILKCLIIRGGFDGSRMTALSFIKGHFHHLPYDRLQAVHEAISHEHTQGIRGHFP